MYASGTNILKARLEAHHVAFDTMHHTLAPWMRRGGKTEWVQARSTVPFAQLPPALREDPSARPPSDAASLHEAVKALYAADPALLPTPRGAAPAERADVSTYLDDQQGHVLVVYVPRAPALRLEFVSFALTI